MTLHVGGGGEHDEGVLSDINVTPLVDVMLVLLVVFMITAPMLHQGVEVALPRAEAENLEADVEDPLILSVNRDGLVYLKEDPIHDSQLVERLLPIVESRSDKSVFLKGDKDVPYGRIVEILDLLRQGGIERIGMITEQKRDEDGA